MDCLSRAALYIRVSTEEQASEGQSVSAQIETLTQYCKLYNFEIYDIYKDLGISGKDTKNRPGLIRMLSDAKQAKFNHVLVWKISRLSRNLKDLLLIIDELEQSKVAFSSYSEKFDTSSPVGRMTLQLLGSIAEFERNTIIDNVKLGLQEYAKNGGKTGTVLGYDNNNKQLVVNVNEAEIVKLIYKLYTVDKMSLSEIASQLNTQGCRTKRRKLFRKDSISVILSNPVYIGINRHKVAQDDEYLIEGPHPPIIDVLTWKAAQDLKESNKKKRVPRSKKFVFLLSGKLTCPYCGKPMYGLTSKAVDKTYCYYRCKACGCLSGAENIEAAVLQRLEQLLLKKKYADEMILQSSKQSSFSIDISINQLKNELQTSKVLMDKYVLLLSREEFHSSEAILHKIKELETRINQLQSSLDSIAIGNSSQIPPSCSTDDFLEYVAQIFSSQNTIALKRIVDAYIKSVSLFTDKTVNEINLYSV